MNSSFKLIFYIYPIMYTITNFSLLFMMLIHQTLCFKGLTFQTQFSKSSTKTKYPKHPFDHSSIKLNLKQAEFLKSLFSNLSFSHSTVHIGGAHNPMLDCIELIDDTLDQLSNIVHKIDHQNPTHDVQTLLSTVLTNQETCTQILGEAGIQITDSTMLNLTASIENSLELCVSTHDDETSKRRLLSVGEFPEWISVQERKLLEGSIGITEAHAVVASDGSGTHRSVGEAVRYVASLANKGRSVIYVKAGSYNEYIRISTKQKNVMLIGDGKGKSVIIGSRNKEDGWSTFQSATVAAMGDGFIARDITFMNSAGPAKHQAVALRIGSDKSVIYRCSVLGYQDTLYTYSKRQFYKETDIYGTIDFIFGNSAVVLQNCNIYTRKPGSGKHNFVTAQARSNQYQNTGISIQNCRIVAEPNSGSSKTTFLGRPWKEYSRTVVMETFMDESIHPSGWSPWLGSFGLKTVYYGEYMNSGPGASVSERVTWPGSHPRLAETEAQVFTVARFIDGNVWLPSTGVPYDSGLTRN